MRIHAILAAAVLAAAATAQGAVVSPVGAATVEGSGSNSFPFSSAVARRYMQIHSDLGPMPRVITKLSFRLNATTTNFTGTRAHDLELFMGEGRSATNPSYTFDNNYFAPKQLVIPRTLITFGPQGQGVSPGPNPFTGNMDLVLATPFVYTGLNSLIWEATYFGQTSTGTSGVLDAEQSTTAGSSSTATGTGCIASGQSAAMTHTFTVTDIGGTAVMNATVATGPANALTFLALGFTNPNLSFPGLCGLVYTDAVLTTKVIGVTNAAGAITTDTPTLSTIVVPNQIAGVTLATQCFAIDAGSTSPLPIAASNGRIVTVPSPALGRVDLATRILNNAGGTTATEGIFFTTTIGYALVTQFTHL
ncbi:MAG: hypothetical protein FJ265_04735 [Planctomycetes bacterium]|nr:hypothetical protein [Planctomycetota bacterium]